MKQAELKKIVIIGPESTGKSTLCEQLAQYYNTSWCPEFAREYLLTNGTNYTYDDLLNIAKGQVAMEEEYIQSIVRSRQPAADSKQPKLQHEFTIHGSQFTTHHPLLFIDTDMYVMKVWCEFVFGKCHKWITDQITKRKYDLYLLCNTDLPWVKDELREYPDLATREKLFILYKQIMEKQSVPWVEIKGDDDRRFQQAQLAVNKLL